MPQHEFRTLNRQGMDDRAVEAERHRLQAGLSRDEVILGRETSSFFFECEGNAPDVLDRALEVMRSTNKLADLDAWPPLAKVADALPRWFVDARVTKREWKRLQERAEKLWKLPDELQSTAKLRAPWTLGWWAFWMEPEHREWLWFSAEVCSPSRLLVHIDTFSRAVGNVPDTRAASSRFSPDGVNSFCRIVGSGRKLNRVACICDEDVLEVNSG